MSREAHKVSIDITIEHVERLQRLLTLAVAEADVTARHATTALGDTPATHEGREALVLISQAQHALRTLAESCPLLTEHLTTYRRSF